MFRWSRKPATVELSDVQRLKLEPGDIVVLRVPHAISTEHAERITEHMQLVAPGHQVVVLEQGMDLSLAKPTRPISGSEARRLVSVAAGGTASPGVY